MAAEITKLHTGMFLDPKADSIAFEIKLTIDEVALINKFLLVNQHNGNTHGPMNPNKLRTMLPEDVAAFMKDENSWRGGHMALVMSEHGYKSCNL
jgi:hypothetical protein